MRRFERSPVICDNCRGCLVWPLSFGTSAQGHDHLDMRGQDPPPEVVGCPRCGTQVSTTDAYAYVPGLAPPFEAMKEAYNGFRPKKELRRQSLEETAHRFIADRKAGLANLQAELNTPDGFVWLRQRMFYRSSVAFYRCFQLFLGFLVLERRCFKSWASITGYYSRFYFIQAFLNLLLTSWLELDKTAIVFDGSTVRCLDEKELRKGSKRFKKGSSHDTWWALMEALKAPEDYPVEEMGFVLSRFAFNPQDRNDTNYSFDYLFGGFNELEWCDGGAKQMLSHFMPRRRADKDFTDVERFFQDADPEHADVGDFYGDTDVQSLWCSISAYLRVLRGLGIQQDFIRTETLVTLSELHLAGDYENVRQGIREAIQAALDDGYDPTVVDDLNDFWRWS